MRLPVFMLAGEQVTEAQFAAWLHSIGGSIVTGGPASGRFLLLTAIDEYVIAEEV